MAKCKKEISYGTKVTEIRPQDSGAEGHYCVRVNVKYGSETRIPGKECAVFG
jgi:hypothetical protein